MPGYTVHWGNSGYTVIKDSIGQYLICWNRGGHDANYIGPDEFYIARGELDKYLGEGRKP
jgi:hypothetical protein